MHPNPVFRQSAQARNLAFAREIAFGTLAINSVDGPLLSHIPFRLSADGAFLEAHLVRSNPIVRHIADPAQAVVSITGPHGYISPDWYEVEDQVPTWNYVAVHLRGPLQLLEDAELAGILDRLSATMEERLLPKKPWTAAKMNQDVLSRMMRQIVPVRMEIMTVDGTWKLSQNKPDEVRLRAAGGVERAGVGTETDTLARLMRDEH